MYFSDSKFSRISKDDRSKFCVHVSYCRNSDVYTRLEPVVTKIDQWNENKDTKGYYCLSSQIKAWNTIIFLIIACSAEATDFN